MRWKRRENSIMREKRWCSYHQTNGHSDKQRFQQMGKSENFKKWKAEKIVYLVQKHM